MNYNSRIMQNDIRNIWFHLEKNGNKIIRAQHVILESSKKESVKSPIIFEFSFRDGNFLFNDID